MAKFLNLDCICLKVLLGIAAILLLSCPSYAEEAKVYTDDDLSDHSYRPIVDEETSRQKEESLKAWEKARDEELFQEKKYGEEKEAKAKRQATAQRQYTAAPPGRVYAQPYDNGLRTGKQSKPGTRRT